MRLARASNVKEVATGSATATHRYSGRTAVIATKHEKERIYGRPIKIGLGLSIACPEDIDTDQLGTFTDEVERTGTPREAALRKARLGIAMTGMQLGLASEGSFGPHPALPFLAVDHELIAFVDNDLGIEIVESVVSTRTNFGQTTAKSVTELEQFLKWIGFPSHAVIVRPAGQSKTGPLHKGLTDWHQLASAVAACSAVSEIYTASVETDMRADCNPTRRAVIRKAAFKLVRRLLRR
jgi:hypothetical protein